MEEFLEIFTRDTFDIQSSDVDNFIYEIMKYYNKNKRHQYHKISKYVDEKMEQGPDVIEYILNNIHEIILLLRYKENESSSISIDDESMKTNDLILKLEKLYDHIALEEDRLSKNSAVINQSKNEIENNIINTFDNIMRGFQEKVDEISNTLNANIITVVGLFSAIIFVFFGGITGMSSVITGIFSLENEKDLVMPLLILSCMGFVIFNTIFLLLYCIAKIVDKNIGVSLYFPYEKWYELVTMDEGCYKVQGEGIEKCFCNKRKALRYLNKRQRLSRIYCWLVRTLKRVFFRYPYVVIINSLFIMGICYLYSKI